MKPRALAELGWRDFKAVRWWLGLLYRRPKHFCDALEKLPSNSVFRVSGILGMHALVYAVSITIIGRVVLYSSPEVQIIENVPPGTSLLQLQLAQLALGFALGIILGVPFFGIVGSFAGNTADSAGAIVGAIAGGGTLAIAIGMVVGIPIGFGLNIAGGAILGVASGISLSIVFGIAGVTVDAMVTLSIAFAIVLFVGYSTVAGIAFGITFAITLLRAYYYPVRIRCRPG
jgi:hypothetical protein